MIDNGHPPHDLGSHHSETRLIRHAYGEGGRYVPMVQQAQSLWDDLQTMTGGTIFSRSGVLTIGPADATFLAGVKASAAHWEIDLESLDAQAVNARWPQITLPENLVALHEPEAGVLRSEVAVRTYLRLAREAGAVQVFGSPVESVVSENGGVIVATSEGRWCGRKALLSAGTWVTKLFPHLPVTPTRKIFTWHETDGRYSLEDGFPAFVAVMPNGKLFYGFPAEDDALKIGRHDGGQIIGSPEERLPFGLYESDAHEVSEFLSRILPGVGAIRRGASCTYDNSPDEDFVIDTMPGWPNVLVISGLSGHGYKFASVLGEIASTFAQDREAEFDLKPFSLSRFDAEQT